MIHPHPSSFALAWRSDAPLSGLVERYGVTRQCIWKRAKRAGLAPRVEPPPSWTAERDEALRALLGTGLSAREIGSRLGVSRGAVLGRAHRLGLRNRAGGAR